jgi:hypothetical protein
LFVDTDEEWKFRHQAASGLMLSFKPGRLYPFGNPAMAVISQSFCFPVPPYSKQFKLTETAVILLVLQQPLLAGQSTGVTHQFAVVADYPVAG